MPGPMGGGMRGPGRRMQGGTRVENPGKIFKRLMAYIFKNYGIHFIFVLICIVLSVVASIQGTLFMQRLIDDYIMPMIGQETPDFSNLFREIVRVAGFYLVVYMLPCPHTGSLGTLYNLAVYLFRTYQSYIAFVGLNFFIQQIKDSLGTCLCHDDTVQLLADLADRHVKAFVKG